MLDALLVLFAIYGLWSCLLDVKRALRDRHPDDLAPIFDFEERRRALRPLPGRHV